MPLTVERDLDAVLHHLMHLRGERMIPTETLLRRAQVLLNKASEQSELHVDRRTQEKLDLLYGLFVQGRMLVPIFSLDPSILAIKQARRRESALRQREEKRRR